MNLEALNREELKEQAELLGVKFDSKASDKALRNKISAKLGEPVDEPELSHSSVATSDEKITIVMAESERDKQPVVVAVNGRNYIMNRGKPVSVPPSVIEVLNHAVKTVWDEEMKQSHQVMRYPYQIVAQ